MRLNIQPTSDGDGPIEDTFKVTSESGVYLMNAIMVVVVTYLAAFRSLNTSRALAEYDHQVQLVLARPRPCEKFHKFLAIFVVCLVEGSLAYYLFSTGNRAGGVLAETILKSFFCLVGMKGFLSLIELVASDLEVFRRPFHGVAILKVHKIENSSVKRGALIAVCAACALYSVAYPNMLLESVAMLGVASIVVRNPTFFAPRLSVRSVALSVFLLPALAILVSSVLCIIARQSKQNPIPSWMDLWLLSAFQFWGIGAAGVLTALVLRYEYNISDPSYRPLLAAEKAPPAGSKGTVRVFTKEGAFAARVPIQRERPQFPRPLFRALIFLSFLVHVPTIGLTLCAEMSAHGLDYFPAWVRVCAESLVTFPTQLWTAFVLPAAVWFACLLRSDGAQLWRYSELWVRPVMPAAELDNVVVVSAERVEQPATETNAEKVPFDV